VHGEPAAFLRWEGPLAEPDDSIVRVDLLPGEPSEDAAPTRNPAVRELRCDNRDDSLRPEMSRNKKD